MDPGLPQLTERFLISHPFACRVFGCRRVVAWMDGNRQWASVGFCDEHRTCAATIPIAIFGREHQGWICWPLTLAEYLALRARGAVR